MPTEVVSPEVCIQMAVVGSKMEAACTIEEDDAMPASLHCVEVLYADDDKEHKQPVIKKFACFMHGVFVKELVAEFKEGKWVQK